MIFTIIQYSIVSLVFISIVHYLISHLTDNLTTPQVRDIVTSTNQQYEAIIRKIEGRRKEGDGRRSKGDMKDDLKQYLKSLNDTPPPQKDIRPSGVAPTGFAVQSALGQGSGAREGQQLQTYDSSDSVFGDYDGDAYSSY